jgi:diketogulonate reductase-like aldo/keto reductase
MINDLKKYNKKTGQMEQVAYVNLNNGMKMPNFGLGTCHMHDAQIIKKAVSEIGYRLYDCASYYKNEETVGQAIKELLDEKIVARDELFIISKAWFDELEDVEAACRRSLEKL